MGVVLAALGLDWLLHCINCLAATAKQTRPLTKASVSLTIALLEKSRLLSDDAVGLAKAKRFMNHKARAASDTRGRVGRRGSSPCLSGRVIVDLPPIAERQPLHVLRSPRSEDRARLCSAKKMSVRPCSVGQVMQLLHRRHLEIRMRIELLIEPGRSAFMDSNTQKIGSCTVGIGAIPVLMFSVVGETTKRPGASHA